MTFRDKIYIVLRVNEGCRYETYDDTEKVRTWGTGHALRSLTVEQIEALIKNRKTWSDVEMDANFLDARINSIISDLQLRFPLFNAMSEVHRLCFIDLCYNLGISGLLGGPVDTGFPMFLKAFKEGKYSEAKACLIDSAWHVQTKLRAERIEWMIENNMVHQDYFNAGLKD